MTTLAILLASKGAKPEYLVGAYPMLFACGGVDCESWLARARGGRATAMGAYENHKPIYIARGLKTTFAELWPKVRHYQ